MSLQHSSVLYCLAADEDVGTQYKTIQHTVAAADENAGTQSKTTRYRSSALYCLKVYCRKTIQHTIVAADENAGTQYKTIQHTIATVCYIASKCIVARQYNTLLQQLMRMRAPLFGGVSRVYNSTWPCVALCHTVLQRLKVLCSVLQRWPRTRPPILGSRSRVCFSMLHCIATCCSELQ